MNKGNTICYFMSLLTMSIFILLLTPPIQKNQEDMQALKEKIQKLEKSNRIIIDPGLFKLGNYPN